MRKTSITIVAVLLGLLSLQVSAKDYEHDIICAVVDVNICGYEAPCADVKPSTINAPDFLKIDLKKNEIVGRRHDGSYGTFKVLEQMKTDRLILLQGMQEDEEDKDDAAAWSVTLHIATGRMSIAVSGEEAAYALFGNCHEL